MENLSILWTNDNADTARQMVFMYAENALKLKWWDSINVIIWGASASLVARDEEIQKGVRSLIRTGVKVEACKACAKNLGTVAQLEELGVEVKYMGEPLTEILKSGKRLLTV